MQVHGFHGTWTDLKFELLEVLETEEKDEEISSFSSNLKNRAVLKYDDNDHRLDIYHYIYLCFARKSDTVSTEIKGYHGKWLTNDCYVFTYYNEENQKKVYVSTFGDRGDGISYFNIFKVNCPAFSLRYVFVSPLFF